MDKTVKILLNSLRCPVCKSLIDVLIYPLRTTGDYNYCCASNQEHYILSLISTSGLDYPNDLPIDPIINKDRVVVYEGRYRYIIEQWYPHFAYASSDSVETEIVIQQVDLEHRVIDIVSNKKFIYDKCLFNWSKTNRDRIINRIKTILTFQ